MTAKICQEYPRIIKHVEKRLEIFMSNLPNWTSKSQFVVFVDLCRPWILCFVCLLWLHTNGSIHPRREGRPQVMRTITRHRHRIIETLQLDVGKPAVSQPNTVKMSKAQRLETTKSIEEWKITKKDVTVLFRIKTPRLKIHYRKSRHQVKIVRK